MTGRSVDRIEVLTSRVHGKGVFALTHTCDLPPIAYGAHRVWSLDLFRNQNHL